MLLYVGTDAEVLALVRLENGRLGGFAFGPSVQLKPHSERTLLFLDHIAEGNKTDYPVAYLQFLTHSQNEVFFGSLFSEIAFFGVMVSKKKKHFGKVSSLPPPSSPCPTHPFHCAALSACTVV